MRVCLLLLMAVSLFPACARNVAVTPVQPLNGSGALVGTLIQNAPCTNVVVALLNAQGQPLYQTTGVPGGTFELHAAPGTYNLVAQGTGCLAQQAVTLQPNQVTQVSVTLYAAGGLYNNPGGVYSPYACPYGAWGCNGSYYPGTGGGVVGKPNVYVSGPVGTSVRARVRFSSGSNLLAAAPAHGPEGWAGTFGESGPIDSQGVQYPFFYYDARIDTAGLQASEAFCQGGAESVAKMETYLREAGFQDREVQDFRDYWTTRLPPARSFCVYPQRENVIDAVATLEVEPKPDSVTRVWFFLVPREETAARVPRDNVKRWFAKTALASQSPRRAAMPARKIATEPVVVREWGVGFLVE